MFLPRSIQPYHFQAILSWWDSTFKYIDIFMSGVPLERFSFCNDEFVAVIASIFVKKGVLNIKGILQVN